MTVKHTKKSPKAGRAEMPVVAEALENRCLLTSQLAWGIGWGAHDVLSSASLSATDPNGNTYVAGVYGDLANVAGWHQPPHYVNAANSQYDVFVAKYSHDGALLWFRRFGGPGADTVTALTLGGDGYLYMAGTFSKNITITTEHSKDTYISRGRYDAFIVRMHVSTGVTNWSGRTGGEFDDSISAITVDTAGRLYIAGWVRRAGNIAPTGKAVNVVDRGTDDTFIERLNPANGNLMWYKIFGENNTGETVLHMVADPAGGLIASGLFNSTVQFDRSSQAFTRTTAGGFDIYIAGITPDGKFRYVRQFGGQHDDQLSNMVLAPNGDLYFIGPFDQDINVSANPAKPVNLNAIYNTSIYVTRMKLDGTIVWAKQFGGDGYPSATALAVDPTGNVYITGAFTDNTNFNTGPATTYLTTNKNTAGVVPNQQDSSDAYLLKLNPAGNFISVDQIGGPDGSVAIYDLGVTATGQAYLVGQFVRTIDIRPGPGTYKLATPKTKDTSDVLIMSLLTHG